MSKLINTVMRLLGNLSHVCSTSLKVLIRDFLPKACDHPNVVLSSDGFHSLIREEVARIGYRDLARIGYRDLHT
jgi:hypothetical protein